MLKILNRAVNGQSGVGQPDIRNLGNVKCSFKAQLKSGQSVRFSRTPEELLSDAGNGIFGGLELTAQMGIIELSWCGELFGTADSDGAVVELVID